MNPILTAKVGDNSDLIPDVISLYVPEGAKILDMTYGLGVFWKKVDLSKYELVKNDLDPERGDTHCDFRATDFVSGFFNTVILDPPYASRSGSAIKASIDRGYNNAQRAFEQGIFGTEAVMSFYKEGMKEAWRVLKSKGILMVKNMDEIMSGQQQRNHITIYKNALEMGYKDLDLFILVQKGVPTMRHDYQLHARKNHSYLWVFQKP